MKPPGEVFVVTEASRGARHEPGRPGEDQCRIVRSVAEQIRRVAPAAIIVVVSNPLDVMCHVAMQASGFPRERARHGGSVDTAATGPSWPRRWTSPWRHPGDGARRSRRHDGALVSYTTVSGIPVTQLLEQAKLDAIVDRARNGGAEIVGLLKTVRRTTHQCRRVQMVEAIALDKKRILPCACGCRASTHPGRFCGVPVKLGRKGLEQIVDIRLTRTSRRRFTRRPRGPVHHGPLG